MTQHSSRAELKALTQDAGNRALRTFVTNISIDVGVAIVLVLTTTFGAANAWGDLEWSLLGFTLLKTVISSAGSFILRRFLDGSALPTPLPPAPVPPPNEDENLEEGRQL